MILTRREVKDTFWHISTEAALCWKYYIKFYLSQLLPTEGETVVEH